MTQWTDVRDFLASSVATVSQLRPKQHRISGPALARPGILMRFSLCLAVLVCGLATAWAGVGGSISGAVKDPSGAAIAKASVTLVNAMTGVRQAGTTDDHGAYTFPVVPVGEYAIEVNSAGFKPYRRTGIVLDTNTALVVDAVLQVGDRTDAVTVSDSAVHLDTISSQVGEVINNEQMSAVPLNGRSYTDLLSLQAGVAPQTSINVTTVQDVGASALSPSGDLNPGTVSINGQREFANAFIVNGSDSEEDVNMGTAIIPNLDSIAEFRILTSNFDAEYGEFSGGQINVITKSGSNSFHGDVFEFLRNTDLDARNYFSPTRGEFIQNQFGATVGGPIQRNKIFFFGDYQGTRQRLGVDTGLVPVPSAADRSGNLIDDAGAFTTTETLPDGQPVTVPTTVTSSAPPVGWASTLSQNFGYNVTPGEPYYFSQGEMMPNLSGTYANSCTSTAECVFPNARIPQSAWSVPAQNLLQYIPAPNAGDNSFATSAFNQALRDDKTGVRIDANTGWGLISGYYFLDDYSLDNPYPVAQGGASVPGFNARYFGKAQLFSLGDTKTVNNTTVNEAHFSVMRAFNDLGRPIGGLGVSLASQGFVSNGTPTIVALDPKGEGVENLVFNNFSTGTNTNELKQANNTFQVLDNLSKVVGRHSLKFGGEFHYDQINTNPIAQFNGNFLFTGSETGVDFADFLLGIPSQYNQSQLNPFYGRNKYAGLFAQDGWHARSNLTLNYGLRWDRIEPWYEKYNQISTTEPGKQSVVFPGAPAGILYPTDPGVRRTLAPPGEEFSPRIGLAYSPNVSTESFLGKILGGPAKTSLRAGFGLYYTSIEALTVGVLAANAPYGTTYTSPAPPTFSNPFVTASNQQDLGQYFPVTFAPLNSSASHPDTTLDWSQYVPISGIPAYPVSNRIPYTEQYMFSLERQVGDNTVLNASFVGNQSHRLLVLVESNAGDPALCMSLSQQSQVLPGSATCGPFGESNVFQTSAGTINGTRGPLGPNFGSNTNQATIGNSHYNALELSLRHTSKRLQVFASYTFSKSIDQSSNVGEEVNPVNPALSRGLSSFNVDHNFVVSYAYELPFDRLFNSSSNWTKGWTISGITHFSSGFPVTLLNYGDNSLLGAEPNGINNFGVDEPQFTPGPLELNSDPRNGKSYFNTSRFNLQPIGTPGNSRRRFFDGPGLDNYDMALMKNISLTESKSLQFRMEAFNVFNHTQFFGPTSVNGNINDSQSFGQVVSAAAPRQMQAALKFMF
jgi:hypothetical protein